MYRGSSPASSIRHFQHVVGTACIAAGIAGDFLQHVIGRRQIHLAQPALAISKRAPQQQNNLLLSQRLEHINPAAREQRGINLEGRILGCGPDQPDIPFLDMRQERILLRLIEAMNLVDEHDRPGPILPCPLRVSHDLLDLFDPGEHRREFNKLRLGHIGDDFGERSLARTWRAPEDDGASVIALDRNPQRLPRPDQMFLPYIRVQGARTHAIGERPRSIVRAAGIRHGLKKAHLLKPIF
jgi:hypothetical protein